MLEGARVCFHRELTFRSLEIERSEEREADRSGHSVRPDVDRVSDRKFDVQIVLGDLADNGEQWSP